MALTDIEKKTLLRLARTSIESKVFGTTLPVMNPTDGGLTTESGAFVSIHKQGRLRGCIGTFGSPTPLYRTVIDMAAAAAMKDPRFSPIGIEELTSMEIEISVLSPLREIKSIDEIETGRHGLYIVKGRCRGVLLPQVAVEHGFDRLTFLEQTCEKAGLAPDDWQKGATIFVFEAEIFRESEFLSGAGAM